MLIHLLYLLDASRSSVVISMAYPTADWLMVSVCLLTRLPWSCCIITDFLRQYFVTFLTSRKWNWMCINQKFIVRVLTVRECITTPCVTLCHSTQIIFVT
jgi:hypothetical protein